MILQLDRSQKVVKVLMTMKTLISKQHGESSDYLRQPRRLVMLLFCPHRRTTGLGPTEGQADTRKFRTSAFTSGRPGCGGANPCSEAGEREVVAQNLLVDRGPKILLSGELEITAVCQKLN